MTEYEEKLVPERLNVGVYKSQLYHLQRGICRICDTETHWRDFVVDHIRPIHPREGEEGGDNNVENLQGACKTCNAKKSNRPEYKPPEGGFQLNTYQFLECAIIVKDKENHYEGERGLWRAKRLTEVLVSKDRWETGKELVEALRVAGYELNEDFVGRYLNAFWEWDRVDYDPQPAEFDLVTDE